MAAWQHSLGSYMNMRNRFHTYIESWRGALGAAFLLFTPTHRFECVIARCCAAVGLALSLSDAFVLTRSINGSIASYLTLASVVVAPSWVAS